MVSIHTPLSPTRTKTIPEFENSSKKRKFEDPEVVLLEDVFDKPVKSKSMKSIFDTELHLEIPLPLEWQRCLDIKSGQIHFYNTRTQKRTTKDPRLSPEPPSPFHMSLDLELNLPCGSVKKNHVSDNFMKHNSGNNSGDELLNSSRSNKNSSSGPGLIRRIPSWLAFEGGDEKEMVTAVCKRCHMLVMMCKSSPSCPNCKFVYPPDQSPPNLFKPRLSLLC
uniref:WW domain-containing protein n=1 Tax=Davidia involucrata TaxID=16924 RepID=A0A5B7BB16_DAVIN